MTAPDKPGLSNEEFIEKCPKCHQVFKEDLPDPDKCAYCGRPQSPPVAQVEVYRKALESAEEWMAEDGCDCGTDEPGTCGLCLVRALLTSKPEPVAQARKWEAEDVVGEIVFHESSSVLGDDGERSIDVRFEDLSPEVQDALKGRKKSERSRNSEAL